jgi:hypothetical protein
MVSKVIPAHVIRHVILRPHRGVPVSLTLAAGAVKRERPPPVRSRTKPGTVLTELAYPLLSGLRHGAATVEAAVRLPPLDDLRVFP